MHRMKSEHAFFTPIINTVNNCHIDRSIDPLYSEEQQHVSVTSMDKITENETIEKNENEFDAAFKSVMHRTDILARLVRDWIPELKDKDLDYIKGCLSPDGMEYITGRETELRNSHMGMVNADCIFDIRFPSEEDRVGLILGVEGQGRSNPGYPITNRAMVYASYLLSDQKDKVFRKQEYGKVKKVYAVWIMLHPNADYRNKIIRYKMKGVCEWPSDTGIKIPEMDLVDILFVNLGSPDSEVPNDMLGILNTIFTDELGKKERENRIADAFKIRIDNELSESLERIRMSMGSDLREAIIEDRVEEAIQKRLEAGEFYTAEQMAEQKELLIESHAETVRKLINKGMPIDESLQMIPSDIREEVEKRITDSN